MRFCGGGIPFGGVASNRGSPVVLRARNFKCREQLSVGPIALWPNQLNFWVGLASLQSPSFPLPFVLSVLPPVAYVYIGPLASLPFSDAILGVFVTLVMRWG